MSSYSMARPMLVVWMRNALASSPAAWPPSLPLLLLLLHVKGRMQRQQGRCALSHCSVPALIPATAPFLGCQILGVQYLLLGRCC